jgi:CHAD domain-containing protein
MIMALDENTVQKPVRKLRKLLKKNPRQPTPDNVHDLRTNTRRLEAALSALSLDSRREEQRWLKDLARVRKRAGKVRDMDVLTGFASTVHPDGEQDCSVQLLEHLGAQRYKHATRLNSVIAKRRKAIRKHLKEASRDFDKTFSQPSKDGGSTTASAQATASALNAQSQLADPPRLGKNNLHPYRLKVKELRNVLKMAANSDQQEFVDELGSVKDAIGEWHDWEELIVIARDVLDHGPTCKLLRGLRQIADEKYRRALSRAENMRKKYLRISPNKPGTQHARPTQPVWKATSAIPA